MGPTVKPAARRYNAASRRAAAQRTRRAILDAAVRLFSEGGYVATTMADIAAAAGVALDTVYATVGRKPTLFRLLIETAISGTDEPVASEERDYVAAIRAEPDAGRKLDVYAEAMRAIHARLAPLLRVLQAAAPLDPELAQAWRDIAERRARNMRALVAELARTGSLREGLSVDEAADVIWATNSAEFYVLLVYERGWQPARYARWLGTAWRRLLLRDP
ncbi:MAG TPA: TetR family transcriptional regulator [Chloroflexota bacterium]